ncbi:unnamed protein product [Musa acuminata subsp. burmannicoides]
MRLDESIIIKFGVVGTTGSMVLLEWHHCNNWKFSWFKFGCLKVMVNVSHKEDGKMARCAYPSRGRLQM